MPSSSFEERREALTDTISELSVVIEEINQRVTATKVRIKAAQEQVNRITRNIEQMTATQQWARLNAQSNTEEFTERNRTISDEEKKRQRAITMIGGLKESLEEEDEVKSPIFLELNETIDKLHALELSQELKSFANKVNAIADTESFLRLSSKDSILKLTHDIGEQVADNKSASLKVVQDLEKRARSVTFLVNLIYRETIMEATDDAITAQLRACLGDATPKNMLCFNFFKRDEKYTKLQNITESISSNNKPHHLSLKQYLQSQLEEFIIVGAKHRIQSYKGLNSDTRTLKRLTQKLENQPHLKAEFFPGQTTAKQFIDRVLHQHIMAQKEIGPNAELIDPNI